MFIILLSTQDVDHPISSPEIVRILSHGDNTI
jgi:hypothetical protein